MSFVVCQLLAMKTSYVTGAFRSIRLLAKSHSRLLLVKLSVVQSFSHSQFLGSKFSQPYSTKTPNDVIMQCLPLPYPALNLLLTFLGQDLRVHYRLTCVKHYESSWLVLTTLQANEKKNNSKKSSLLNQSTGNQLAYLHS